MKKLIGEALVGKYIKDYQCLYYIIEAGDDGTGCKGTPSSE